MARRVRSVTETTTEQSKKLRNRRTPEQIVADLQAEIEAVKARAAAKEARANPQAKAILVAVKALDKAAESCTADAKKALETARGILADQMAAMGIRTPQAKQKRQEAA